jgi:hypothetical protein
METWEENILEGIVLVDEEIDKVSEDPTAHGHPRRWPVKTAEKTGLELRKCILEDALLIGRHGLPKNGEKACVDPDCKLWPDPHIESDKCHIFGT